MTLRNPRTSLANMTGHKLARIAFPEAAPLLRLSSSEGWSRLSQRNLCCNFPRVRRALTRRATEVPGLKFIQFKGANGNLITAKVFAFQTYKRRLLQQSVPDNGRMIVVAMQMKGEPSVQPVSLKCKPLDKPEACFAYSGEYDQGAGARIPILVLTAR